MIALLAEGGAGWGREVHVELTPGAVCAILGITLIGVGVIVAVIVAIGRRVDAAVEDSDGR